MHDLRQAVIKLAHDVPEMRKHLVPILRKTASTGTVEGFLFILAGWLTQYDKKLSVRQPNIYRLGHYLAAVQNTRKVMAKYMKSDVRDPGVADRLKKALMNDFSHSGTSFDLSPVNKLVKAIDVYVAGGPVPSYKNS